MSQIEERGRAQPGAGAPEPTGIALDAAASAQGQETGDARSTWRGTTFAALTIPVYRFLWAGSVLAMLSVQMQMIARSWLAYELTGSNSILGAVMFGFGLPMLLLTPWGGVAADRFNKRNLILMSQWILIASGLMIALAIVFDVLSVPLLILSSVAQGVAFAFMGPARMAFTSHVVGRRLLVNAIVLQQMSMQGTRVFGPSLAGVLIAWQWFGAAGVYFMTSGFTIVASMLTMRLPRGEPRGDRVPASAVSEFADGLRYVRRNPHLMLLLVVSMIVIMTAFPYIAFLPTLAEDVFNMGSEGYGLMSAVTAVGAVSASLLIAGRSGSPNIWKLQASAGLVLGIGLVMLRFTPNIWTALAVLLFVGAANAGFQAVNNSLVLMGSESQYHGRMQSLMMLSFSGFGLMALPLGIIADAIGLQNLLAVMGSFTAAAMVAYFVLRPAIERRHPTPVFVD
ncbi:MAG: MFS transporter [Acidimicrobiales bacterium]|nr:MFS transporter [Acidimicrobiales bacterium]